MSISNKLIRRISKTSRSEVMHSSGYARFQSTNTFGAAGGDSFSQRQKIEQNRKTVQSYAHSRLGSQRSIGEKVLTDAEKSANEAASTRKPLFLDSEKTSNDPFSAHFDEKLSFSSRRNGQQCDARSIRTAPHANYPQYGRISSDQIHQIRQDGARRFGGLGRVDGARSGSAPSPKTGGFQGKFGSH